MKNCGEVSQCWVLEAFKELLTVCPHFREEVLQFLGEFKGTFEEVRLMIYEIQTGGEKLFYEFDEDEVDFQLEFLAEFV